MIFYVVAVIKAMILSPLMNIILISTGLCLIKKYKTASYFFIYFGALTLVLFCFPPFSHGLLQSLERYPALEPPLVVDKEQAIVVLSSGSHSMAKEFGKAVDTAGALERNHYAAFLHKQTGLPILVSGGYVGSSEISQASVMTDTLTNSFNVPVKWQEERSHNTAENAIYSVELLKQNNIDTIYLVTHAWHMYRAVMMFEQQGIKVTPAPTMFTSYLSNSFVDHYFPNAYALLDVRIALHEYIGILWYKLRY